MAWCRVHWPYRDCWILWPLIDALSLELVTFADLFVDEDSLAVIVAGTAKWTYKTTGKSWNATFTWVLEFAEGETEGGLAEREVKIRKYSVWADSGAVSCTTFFSQYAILPLLHDSLPLLYM